MKNVILYLTNKHSDIIIDEYYKLKNELNTDKYDIFILYHSDGNIPDEIKNINHFSFTDSIFNDLGFNSINGSLIPGSLHFPIFSFAKEYPDYNNYWFIEDDVRFNGDWKTFFDNVDNIKCDLLSTQVRDINKPEHRFVYSERSKVVIQWFWFNSLKHPFKKINDEDKLVSFNPIYRLSNNAVKYLFNELSDGWVGHNEIILASLLKNGGYSVVDFGGNNSYTCNGNEGLFYNNETHRYLPIYEEMGEIENFIYHPVKKF